MRERQPDPVVDVAGIETVIPAERDFFDRIIEQEYKIPETEEKNRRESRIREHRVAREAEQ